MSIIAFVNESLKDNHQVEIVEALIKKGTISGFISLSSFSAKSLDNMIQKEKERTSAPFAKPKYSILDKLINEG